MSLKPNEEAFARAMAGGASGADAYAAIHPRASRKTATERASRWARNDKVRTRIAELRAGMADAQAQRDADVAGDVATKLKVALLTTQERRSLIAARVRRADITDAGLARLLYLDAQLAGELVDRAEHTQDGDIPARTPLPRLNLPAIFFEPRILPPERVSNSNGNGTAARA